DNVRGLKDLGINAGAFKSQTELLERIGEHINVIVDEAEAMRQERKKANILEDIREKAVAYDEKVKPYFDKIRYHLNKLEQIVDDRKWPLPKLRELLFVR